MEEIPCYFYEGSSLEEKYQWMHSGPGGVGSIGFGDGLAHLAADFNASDSRIGQNLVQRKLGAEWQGQAASAATDALNRAATAIAANAGPGNTGRDSSHQYGDSFNAAKNAIQQVPDAGQNSWWGHQADSAGAALNDTFGSTFGVQSDYSRRLAAYRAADQAANDALYKHETTSRTVLTAYQNAITGQAAGPNAVPGMPPRGGSGTHGGGGAGAGGAGMTTGGARSGAAGPGAASAGATGGAERHGSASSAAGGAARHGSAPGAGGPAGAPPTAPPTLPTGSAPTTAPAGFDPLGPPGGAGGGGLVPGPSGGFVPAGPGFGAGSPPSSVPPPLPPLGGGYSGVGGDPYTGERSSGNPYASAGHGGGSGGGRPLSPRGGSGIPAGEAPGRFTGSGFPEGGGAGGRPGGPGGLAGGGMGGMGGGMGGGQDREHRNSVFIPDDEPFRIEFDDVTSSVIGLPDEH
jgi:hypothetical protein